MVKTMIDSAEEPLEPRELTDDEFDRIRRKAAAELADFQPGERVSLFDGMED